MNKIKIIALFGKSGAGKDFIQKKLMEMYDFHKVVSCTTRPKRDYEEEGKDYFFVDNIEFSKKVLNGDMLEATCFREWFYGTPIQGLDENKINVGVFNIEGIETLREDSRIEVYPVYVTATDKIRLIRQLEREHTPDCAEICRRFQTDEKDFAFINFPYDEYSNMGLDLDFRELRALVDNLIQ